jgi:transcription elongation factor Elf1
MLESYFTCPYCFEEQIKLVDFSISQQSFIEDCEVCCNPIEFIVSVEDGCISQMDAIAIGQ